MYHIRKVNPWDIPGLFRVEQILYRCGKDMAQKYGLQHWNNSHLKNVAVVVLCLMKNRIWLVMQEDGSVAATFQTKAAEGMLCFQKLATDPAFSGRGVGSFCVYAIEEMARKAGCRKVCCQVYDQSLHAIGFYENRGYTAKAQVRTRKYTQLQMEKQLME